MLKGLYVVHDEKCYQIHHVATSSIAGPRGIPIPATTYSLVKDGALTTVKVPADLAKYRRFFPVTPIPQVDLLPACGGCMARLGWPCEPDCIHDRIAAFVAV